MKILLAGLILAASYPSLAEVVNCPAIKQGKPLTDVAFFEGSSPESKTALPPTESRVEGDDLFQVWNVVGVNEKLGLQMVCKYQAVPAGTFIMVQKASTCTLSKKSGHVTAGCK